MTADYDSFGNWRHEAMRVLVRPVGVHLDLCVGNSNFAHRIPSRLMVGADLNRERLADHDGRYLPLYLDAREVPTRFFPGTVDLVTMFDALEHLPKADGMELLAALETVATTQVLLFIPVETWDAKEENERLARWNAGEYGIHLATWSPEEMRALGYEVLYNPTYHQRPDRTFGAMFCWKTLKGGRGAAPGTRKERLEPTTEREFDAIAETPNSEVEQLRGRLQEQQGELRKQRREVARVRRAYEASRSWRVTRPLRAVRRMLRRSFRERSRHRPAAR